MTEEEYERLCGATEGHGARSVSEFARNTLLTQTPRLAPPPCDCSMLDAIDERLVQVEQEVAQVKEELSHRRKAPDSL